MTLLLWGFETNLGLIRPIPHRWAKPILLTKYIYKIYAYRYSTYKSISFPPPLFLFHSLFLHLLQASCLARDFNNRGAWPTGYPILSRLSMIVSAFLPLCLLLWFHPLLKLRPAKERGRAIACKLSLSPLCNLFLLHYSSLPWLLHTVLSLFFQT